MVEAGLGGRSGIMGPPHGDTRETNKSRPGRGICHVLSPLLRPPLTPVSCADRHPRLQIARKLLRVWPAQVQANSVLF